MRAKSQNLALYLFTIHPGLYKQATNKLKAEGCILPNPLTAVHAHIACDPRFTPTLRKALAAKPKVCMESKTLGGVSCYDQGPHFSFSTAIPQPPHVPPVPQPPHVHTHMLTPVHVLPQTQPQDIPLPPSLPMSIDRPDYSDPHHHVPLPLALLHSVPPFIFPNYPLRFPFVSPMFHPFIYQDPWTANLTSLTTLKTLFSFAFILFYSCDSIP